MAFRTVRSTNAGSTPRHPWHGPAVSAHATAPCFLGDHTAAASEAIGRVRNGPDRQFRFSNRQRTVFSDVLLFWIAFIFTRPFGATFGDFLTKPLDHGGLAMPRDHASLITVALLGFVLLVSTQMSRRLAVAPD